MADDISSRHGLMTSLACHHSLHASQIIAVDEILGKWEVGAGGGGGRSRQSANRHGQSRSEQCKNIQN